MKFPFAPGDGLPELPQTAGTADVGAQILRLVPVAHLELDPPIAGRVSQIFPGNTATCLLFLCFLLRKSPVQQGGSSSSARHSSIRLPFALCRPRCRSFSSIWGSSRRVHFDGRHALLFFHLPDANLMPALISLHQFSDRLVPNRIIKASTHHFCSIHWLIHLRRAFRLPPTAAECNQD